MRTINTNTASAISLIPLMGKHLFTIEHEVRSATHPMYLRPLINRNPVQTNRTFASGHDQWLWAMGPDQYDPG